MLIRIRAVVSVIRPSHGKSTFGLWVKSKDSEISQKLEIPASLEQNFAIGDEITVVVEKE